MKTVFLLRHAEAASPNSVSDRDRPLTDKGRVDAKNLGNTMRARGFIPAVILCSPAKRTRETLDGLVFGGIPTVFPETLYNAPPENVLNALRQVDDAQDSVLLIAHNPSIAMVAVALAGLGEATVLTKLNTGYAPATLSVLELNAESWLSLQQNECRLIEVLTP